MVVVVSMIMAVVMAAAAGTGGLAQGFFPAPTAGTAASTAAFAGKSTAQTPGKIPYGQKEDDSDEKGLHNDSIRFDVRVPRRNTPTVAELKTVFNKKLPAPLLAHGRVCV